jgi:heme-degrading monooxygenase HmoA
MILEIADIRIPPGRNAEFDAAIQHGIESVIMRAEGYCQHRVVKGIESPERYVLMIWWQTLEDHTVKFRGGPLFAEWRAIVQPFFAVPPSVEHYSLVTASAGVPS